jgi:lysozyme family protein
MPDRPFSTILSCRRLPDLLSEGRHMPDKFNRVLIFVFDHEDGYSDHPKDPGGATKFGITQRVLDEWRRSQGRPTMSVISLTKEEATDIYFDRYWQPLMCRVMFEPIALMLMDTGVNIGIYGAAKIVQRCVGVAADGFVGSKTINAITSAYARFVTDSRQPMLLWQMHMARCSYYETIVNKNPILNEFLTGWMRRASECLSLSLDVHRESRSL